MKHKVETGSSTGCASRGIIILVRAWRRAPGLHSFCAHHVANNLVRLNLGDDELVSMLDKDKDIIIVR